MSLKKKINHLKEREMKPDSRNLSNTVLSSKIVTNHDGEQVILIQGEEFTPPTMISWCDLTV